MKYPKLREAVRVGGVEINLRMAVVLCLVVILTMAYGYHSRFLETWLRPVGLESLADGAVGVGHTQFLLFFVVPLTAVLLMGDGRPAFDAFRGTDAIKAVLLRATDPARAARYPTVRAFVDAWRQAAGPHAECWVEGA